MIFKIIADWFCLVFLFLFLAALGVGAIALFAQIGVNLYEAEGSLPLALFIGTLPLWTALVFRGVIVLMDRE